MSLHAVLSILCAAPLMLAAAPAMASPESDRAAVAALDIAYQAAVERNDADTIAKIQHPDMILVGGLGQVVTGQQLVDRARAKEIVYEVQAEDAATQTVRLFGDTAIVTARLWIKGSRGAQHFDYRVWFSDTYIRTPQGWRYVFGQAGASVPTAAA